MSEWERLDRRTVVVSALTVAGIVAGVAVPILWGFLRRGGPMGLVLQGTAVSRFAKGQRVMLLSTEPDHRILASLRELAEAGSLTPTIDRTYPLREAAEAIRYVEHEHARAKVVITV